MSTLLEIGGVRSPVNCNQCHLSFSNNETLNIHLKNCLGSKLSKTNNPFTCSLCNRDFRTFNNLLRHEETNKHLEMLDWYRNNYNDSSSNNNQNQTKLISLNNKITHKLSSNNDNNNLINNNNNLSYHDFDNNYNNTMNNNTLNNDTMNIDNNNQDDNFDDFLSSLTNERINQTYKIDNQIEKIDNQIGKIDNQKEKIDNQIGKMDKQRNEFDDFLSQLENNRKKEIEKITNTRNNQIKKNNDNGIGFDSRDDILDEIIQAKELIESEEMRRQEKLRELEKGREPDLIEQVNNYFQKQKEYQNEIDKRGIIFSHVSTPSGGIENQELNQKNKNKIDLDTQLRNHPLWNLLIKLVNEKTIATKFSNILITAGILDLPLIYNFIRFSNHLKGKKDKNIKIQLIKIMLEFEAILVQSYQKKQMIVANKDVPKMLILFKTWNLSGLLTKLQDISK